MYQDVDRSNFRIGQFLEEGMLSLNSLFFLRSYLHTRNRIEDGIRTIERLLIRFGFYPRYFISNASRTIIRRFYPNVISDQNDSLSPFSSLHISHFILSPLYVRDLLILI